MHYLVITIVACAQLAQTPDYAGTARQDASAATEARLAGAADEIAGLTNDLFTLMGTCEAQLPPSLIATVTWPFSPAALADATEDQRARVAPMSAAYAAGQASPHANTLTREECSRELEALSVRMQAKSEGMGL